MFGTSQGLKEETASFQWKNLRSHILKLCLALPIAFPPRSKWPPPRRHFDKELGNLTPRGYLDQGKARSAVSAGGAAAAAGATGAAHAQQAGRAGTAGTTA